MISSLFYFLEDAVAQKVVFGVAVIGFISGVVGVFSFLRKKTLVADAISHAVLPGVCVGFLFAGTKETPGSIAKMGQWPNEQLYKKYQGSASIASKTARGEETKNVEGTSKITPYKGKVIRIVNDIEDGLKSAMSYVGADTIPHFQNQSVFCRVTQAGQLEAKPHGLY